MNITIDTKSPERGWPPFLDWLRDQGIPIDTKAITIDSETLTGTATVMKRRDGKHYVEDGEVAVEQRSFSVSSLSSRRFADTID